MGHSPFKPFPGTRKSQWKFATSAKEKTNGVLLLTTISEVLLGRARNLCHVACRKIENKHLLLPCTFLIRCMQVIGFGVLRKRLICH
jgi:hypothetical protein